MALSSSGGKVETMEAVVDIKSPADKMFTMISSEHHSVPKAPSGNIHDVAVHEGDWATSGSIKLWKYTIDGTAETLKEKVEIDEANKKVSLTVLEGHVLEKYKNYKIIVQVMTAKSDHQGRSGQVKITLECEKLKESGQPPHKYLTFLVNVIKDIDAHLIVS